MTRVLLAALLLTASPALAGPKPIPDAPYSYVHNEGVISPAAAAEAGRRLRALEDGSGRQFVLGLFKSLDGESLEDYTNRVFKAWKVGGAEKDDGLLFCLFLKERRWRVEVGYGLEGLLTDLESAEIAREAGSPRFEAGDYDGGVLAVVAGLSAKIGGPPVERRRRRPPPPFNPARHLRTALVLFFGFYLLFSYFHEKGVYMGLDDYQIGRRASAGPRYPLRVLFLFWLYVVFLAQTLFWLLSRSLAHHGGYRGGGYGGGGGGGGFSGRGGSSGGGGASGSW